jgi:pimeloyl-ACP methyl ester carboxylesterase
VRSYVLVATRAYPPVRVDGLFRVLAMPAFGPGFAALLGRVVGPSKIESSVRASFAPNDTPPDFVSRRAALYMHPTISAALAQERTELKAALEAMAPLYPGIRKRVTVVCGDHDEPNTSQAPRLAGQIPGARFVPLADTGHMVQYARPDELIAIIEEEAAASPR